jgi:hypothetical protein
MCTTLMAPIGCKKSAARIKPSILYASYMGIVAQNCINPADPIGISPKRIEEAGGYRTEFGATIMKKLLLATVSFAAVSMINGARADETLPPMGKTWCDPYKNYSCLDSYLGDDFLTRFVNYYRLEWGHESAPSDPKAPPSCRDNWPATPQSTPPMPFTEWPYGGTTAVGVTRPSSADSPLMAALGNTSLGEVQDAN